MNIIIPIGGPRKNNEGTEYVRSLQEIQRKTIIQRVFESLDSISAAHFIVVMKKEDVKNYHLDSIVKLLRPEAEILVTDGETKGAACTCMLAIDKIDLNKPLLIVGSDQLININLDNVLHKFQEKRSDGGLIIFDDIHPRWSYVKIDENENVIEAAEKRPISRNACAGFYYYRRAEFFMNAAQKMILKNASVNGQYYICPTYNELVLEQKIISTYRIQKSDYFNFNHNSGIEAYNSFLNERQTNNV
ncbi:MAG: nucleotidyltransferase [Firmicutes bacterium]|nr:nucleotidyltransferase [Bacillota bacterium]